MWKFIVVPALALGGLWGADFTACPPSIDVQKQQLAKAVAGWTAAQGSEPRHDLWYVTMYDGEPKEMASLVPDISGKLRSGWTLAPTTRAYWLECHYTQTTLVLARPVPAGAKTCEVTYVPSVSLDGQPVIKQISCR
jgi:hypothetical protein